MKLPHDNWPKRADRPSVALPSDHLSRELISVAVELFSKQGYYRTSVNDILARAHASKGGFYHHFESKEQMLVSIHDSFIDYELATAKQIMTQVSGSAEQLRAVIFAHMESIETYQSYMNVFLQQAQDISEEAFAGIRQKRRQYQQTLEAIIRGCIDEGTFRADVDPKLQALLLIGMLNWAVHWYKPSAAWDINTIAAGVIDTVFHGLEAR